MRTDQDFNNIFNELNVVPSLSQPSIEDYQEGFKICTVLKDVEISYASNTHYYNSYAKPVDSPIFQAV
jgi:hypothetical protein